MTHVSRGINFCQLAKIKYYVGINFHEVEMMIFLEKIMVFNQLFQFSNKKRRKPCHKLSLAKGLRIFREHQIFTKTAKTCKKLQNFLSAKLSSPKVESQSFFFPHV